MKNHSKRPGFVALAVAAMLLLPVSVQWKGANSVLGAVVTENCLSAQMCSPWPACSSCYPQNYEFCSDILFFTIAENYKCGQPGADCN